MIKHVACLVFCVFAISMITSAIGLPAIVSAVSCGLAGHLYTREFL